MGGKSGGGQQTPYEAPNSLSSAQSLRIIDAVSEGVVSGFANGDDAPFKSVYFDDTPVQNSDGSYNFNGVTGYFQRGEQEQSYVPGFDASERTVAVSAAVKQNQPIVRAVTDELVSRLRITVAVERNAQVEDNGDTVPADTLMRVELINSNGVQASNQVRFNEKSSGTYYQDVEFDVVPQVPFNIRVFRISPDSKTDKVSNNTYFSSYVEIVDVKLSYPHTAFAALSIDSAQFGNQIPRRNYLMKGRLVKVPSNYNPETRQYTGGTWDGSFKTAWTNNPAWVFYDVLTQPRFSTLARRLNVADIDKWSLYQIGKYCDEPVDDGFGGKEPRFVCNAYITDLMQAGEFLNNLASVFTGLPVWNGQQVSVVMDADADPVAQYTNANVKDGLFNYAGAALKSIHTAVHVQYIDKYDGYRAKTEYVADNEAIARYGLNIKQITAFGCDSRGQAARFGAWTLQTELRQQNAVTFDIGREGLKHLPYDIVQIMDNQYAGAELSGRVAAISGNVLTLDRPVSDAVGALVFYSEGGSLKSAKITAAAGNKVTLEREVPLQAGDTWVLSGKVKPRLYRAIGIKENTDAGTYTVTALLHDPKKYAAVDSFAHFDHEITTLHNTAPVLTDAAVNTDGGAVVMTWDNLAANGQVLTYDIKIYRNNSLYRHIPDAQTAEIRLENLPNGNYRAEIRGRNARGVLSAPLVKAWSVDYTVTGLRATPRTFAIELAWTLPQTVVSELVSELWYGRENNLQMASKLATLPYPQNGYTLTGVGVADEFFFWVRVRDAAGNSGNFTSAVHGTADKDPAPIVKHLQGAITKSALSNDLIKSLNDDMAAAGSKAAAAMQTEAIKEAARKIADEATNRSNAIQVVARKIADEATNRSNAIQAVARESTAAIQAAAGKAAADLTAKSREIGNKVAEVEQVNTQQAQQIKTVTAAQQNTAAALEAEKTARSQGDNAEAMARNALAARVSTAEGSIAKEEAARIEADKAQAAETAALKTSVGSTESAITALQETVTRQDSARASEISTLTAKLDGMQIGGRNLIRDSASEVRNANYLMQTYSLSDGTLQEGEPVVLTLWGELGSDREAFWPFNSDGWNWLGVMKKVSDGVYRIVTTWKRSKDNPSNDRLLIYCGPNTGKTVSRIDRIKLERGTVATDWTPAPEDSVTAASEVAAQLAAHKTAQAEVDKAQTADLTAAKSALAGAVSDITSIKTTKADKSEVVALARATLASEWKSVADAAKTAAIAAAQADAKTKADAARVAAETAAQAKADAAKTAAVASAAGTAQAKADAAKAAAIAEAAAKDAVVKQQAAADAKAKADAALGAAKTYSDGLNRDVLAKVDRLSETVTRQDSARASEISTLTAKLDGMQIGGRNLIRDSASEVRNANYLMQTYSLSDGTLQEGEPVVLTLWGELGSDREAFWPFNSDGWNWLGVMKKVSDGVYRIVTTWKRSKDNPSNDRLLIYCGPNTGKTVSRIDRIKLERGTVATDWTPAPEDGAIAASNLAAVVQQTSTAVTELGGKVQSLYTLKTEAISGGRKAIAGIAIGADGQTGSGEILLMSNKVGYVDPKDKSVTPAFVTVIENGKAKQALNGDLFATGSILAKHIAANQTIEAPTLNSATVNAGLIKGGTIRGARIEAVDLEAANIIGDVVAVRTFELKQSPLGYQELICQIPDSRKTRRTVIVPPVFAVAENGAVVSLQLHMDGVIQREVTIQSPEKRIARNEKFSVWVPGPPPLYMKTPQEVPLSFSVPFHLPKTGSISFQKGIDGAAHSLHILCRINGNFDYSPLGDLSGIVCLVV